VLNTGVIYMNSLQVLINCYPHLLYIIFRHYCVPWGNVRQWPIKQKVFICIPMENVMYRNIQSYMYDSNRSEQFWQANFMIVVTVCFRSISKDLKPKPDSSCQTGRELARIVFWMETSRCACNSINVTQYRSAQSLLFLSKATCFDWKLVIFRPLQHFHYQTLCPLWDPIVFTVVEYILVKTF